jgi:NAD(P)-dependent dehydrogenase (short-subunit alcohol dehydrogenase family)
MDSKRVLITGNKEYGLCKEICNLFDTVDNIDYFTASRVNDWDLTSQAMQNKLADFFISEGCNVFINNSAMWKFQQTLLAETMYNRIKDERLSAHFIHIGSTADTGVKGRTWRYPTEKKALKNYNRDLSYMAIGGSNVKTTLLSPGSLTTPNVMKKHPDRKLLDVEYIAEVILWLLSQPEYVNINEISLDPIQDGTYARER